MSLKSQSVLDKANGHWRHLLMTIGGADSDLLSGRHCPCPACGGTDRFRFLDQNGTGSFYCSYCGGKNQQGGGGTGIDLLMRVRGWTFRQAVQQVERYYGGLPFQPATRRPVPLPKQTAARHSELQPFLLLEIAGQLAAGECFSPAEARVRLYSKRWAVYAARNYDSARSAILELETERGILEEPARLGQ